MHVTRASRSALALVGLVTVVTASGFAAGHLDAGWAKPTQTATRGASCTPPRPARSTKVPQTFRYANQDRAYLLALPHGYDGRSARPLVFDFHGFLGRKETHEADTSMAKRGAARGDIVVTPDSLGSPPQWNMFGAPDQADDFGFIHALLASLERRLCVDADRVYAAGHSNGSAFAAFLVCKPPYVFAALAMVSATTPSTCPAGVAPGAIAVAGTADPAVPYAGGTVAGTTIPIPAGLTVIKDYASRDRCNLVVQSQPMQGVLRTRYTRCAHGSEFVLDTIVGGTHAWPGGLVAKQDPTDSPAGKAFSATDEILTFFARHARAP